MGWCESSDVYIGFKVKLIDLVNAINNENYETIIKIFSKGYIEISENIDSDGSITFSIEIEHLINDFYEKYEEKIKEDIIELVKSEYFNEYYLIPYNKCILSVEKWGYGIEGNETKSISMEHLSNVNKELKFYDNVNIEYEKVLMLHHSGN